MSEEIRLAASDIAHQHRRDLSRQAMQNIEQARRIVTAASQLAWSLYASGDLSVDQHGPIVLALGVAEAGIKDVEELMDERGRRLAELEAARAVVETVRDNLAGDVSRSAVTVALAKYDVAVKARQSNDP